MRLLALVDSPEHVCCRYRIRAYEAALEREGWTVDYRAIPAGLVPRLRLLVAAADYDAVILQRKLLPGWQIRLLRRYARRLVFDFDDAVLYRDSYDRRGPVSRRRAARFSATVQASDAVIAGNDFLADCALRARSPAHRVRTIPTCIEPGDYPTPAFLASDEGRTDVDLVWIGSASTLQGLQGQRPLWDQVAREVPGLRLRVICDAFPSFDILPVLPIPWSQDREAADLAAGQIGIGWIPDDPWSLGKCGLKVIQYQAAGLPVVANPVGMHVELVEDGITGYLADTPAEWARAIRTLAADPELRRRMGREARARVEARYSIAAWSAAFVGAIADDDERGGVEEHPPRASAAPRAIPVPFSSRPRRSRLEGGAAAVSDAGDRKLG